MSIGKIKEFCVADGNWTLYVERLEMYFKVNKIGEDLWLPTLIAVIGEATYELLSNLTSPKKPADLKYKDVIDVLRKHLQPKRSVMAERYRFRQRRQGADENISRYITGLKQMSKYCEFASTLEDNLRDQFVCGLRSDVIRQRLFAEDELKYEGAIKLACALEAAERDAAVVELAHSADGTGGASGPPAVHVMRARPARAARPAPKGAWTRHSAGTSAAGTGPCSVCGAHDHAGGACRFRNFVCRLCGNKGHLKRVCPERADYAARDRGGRGLHHVGAPATGNEGDNTGSSDSELEEELHQLCLRDYRPVSMSLSVDNILLKMEVDTGSAVSCISKSTYLKYFSNRQIENCEVVLKFYDGTKVKPIGIIRPTVTFGSTERQLELFVIEGGSTSLLGRHWLSELGITVPEIPKPSSETHNVKIGCNDLSLLIDRYKELFSGGLGRFTGGKATLRVREDAVPVFCRARPLPYSIRGQVDSQLDEMLREGVIEPVETSDWATPLVPVRKSDGGLRICADYKITLNPALLVDRYPLPRIEDLLVGLNGAKVFSKIDLTQAYNQVELDDSKKYTVINTHRGLFRYNRLVFGLASSPGIFQRIMSNLLNDIPKVEVFLDDVIVATESVGEHLIILEKIFSRLRSHGLKLKKSKCSFLVDEVRYLGHIISKEGLKVDPSKVEAIVKIPRPTNVNELRSFLGLVNFYAKFVKNSSTVLAPLYKLLKRNEAWYWNSNCEESFKTIKEVLISADVLIHYEPSKQLTLTSDASSKGVAGVLSQPGPGGRERPVAYISRSLTDAEKNYSQIDKEALAIVFCFEKLHQYLYGRRFILRTDHKPLVSIFGPKHGVPAMAASRLQRWAIKLSAYTYDIEYVNTKLNGADGLSRLPLPLSTRTPSVPEQTYLHFAQDAMSLDFSTVKKLTARDPIIGRVLSYVRDGWPTENDIRTLQPYFNRKDELYEELGCVMWGHRVVVPEGCQKKVLQELHGGHMGIVKTKAMARSYVWWPGLDEAVEAVCRACPVCAAEADAPAKQVPCSWPWPAKPWSRVHVDFLGPIFGKIYLIVIDARTKWLEVFEVPSTAAPHAIDKLSETFARWGLPRQLVSDNGPPFTGGDFSKFLLKLGIEHTFAAPYHPASNGAAENAVRTVKRVIKKAAREGKKIGLAMSTFLLYYRNTEHCTTGASPASLMLGRQIRTRLDVFRPDCTNKVHDAQKRQGGRISNSGAVLKSGEEVWMRQYHGSHKWLPGQVSQRLGSRNYTVLDSLGRPAHRHIDQLRRRPRSSLVCPTNQPERNPSDDSVEPVESGVVPPESLTGPNPPTASDKGFNPAVASGAGARQNDSGDVDPRTPPPPLRPLSPQLRPVRKCRVDNPAQYKL